jgi:hypothetical protein
MKGLQIAKFLGTRIIPSRLRFVIDSMTNASLLCKQQNILECSSLSSFTTASLNITENCDLFKHSARAKPICVMQNLPHYFLISKKIQFIKKNASEFPWHGL